MLYTHTHTIIVLCCTHDMMKKNIHTRGAREGKREVLVFCCTHEIMETHTHTHSIIVLCCTHEMMKKKKYTHREGGRERERF